MMMIDAGTLAIVGVVVVSSTLLGFLIGQACWTAYSVRRPKFMYCARCNNMMGSVGVSIPPHYMPGSPCSRHNHSVLPDIQIPPEKADRIDCNNSATFQRLGMRSSISALNFQDGAKHLETRALSPIQASPPESQAHYRGIELLSPSPVSPQPSRIIQIVSDEKQMNTSRAPSRSLETPSPNPEFHPVSTENSGAVTVTPDDDLNNSRRTPEGDKLARVRLLESPGRKTNSFPIARTPANASKKRNSGASSRRSLLFNNPESQSLDSRGKVGNRRIDITSEEEVMEPLLESSVDVKSSKTEAKSMKSIKGGKSVPKSGRPRGSPGNTATAIELSAQQSANKLIDIDIDPQPFRLAVPSRNSKLVNSSGSQRSLEPVRTATSQISPAPASYSAPPAVKASHGEDQLALPRAKTHSVKKVRKPASVRSYLSLYTAKRPGFSESDFTSQDEEDRSRKPLVNWRGPLNINSSLEDKTDKELMALVEQSGPSRPGSEPDRYGQYHGHHSQANTVGNRSIAANQNGFSTFDQQPGLSTSNQSNEARNNNVLPRHEITNETVGSRIAEPTNGADLDRQSHSYSLDNNQNLHEASSRQRRDFNTSGQCGKAPRGGYQDGPAGHQPHHHLPSDPRGGVGQCACQSCASRMDGRQSFSFGRFQTGAQDDVSRNISLPAGGIRASSCSGQSDYFTACGASPTTRRTIPSQHSTHGYQNVGNLEEIMNISMDLLDSNAGEPLDLSTALKINPPSLSSFYLDVSGQQAETTVPGNARSELTYITSGPNAHLRPGLDNASIRQLTPMAQAQRAAFHARPQQPVDLHNSRPDGQGPSGLFTPNGANDNVFFPSPIAAVGSSSKKSASPAENLMEFTIGEDGSGHNCSIKDSFQSGSGSRLGFQSSSPVQQDTPGSVHRQQGPLAFSDGQMHEHPGKLSGSFSSERFHFQPTSGHSNHQVHGWSPVGFNPPNSFHSTQEMLPNASTSGYASSGPPTQSAKMLPNVSTPGCVHSHIAAGPPAAHSTYVLCSAVSTPVYQTNFQHYSNGEEHSLSKVPPHPYSLHDRDKRSNHGYSRIQNETSGSIIEHDVSQSRERAIPYSPILNASQQVQHDHVRSLDSQMGSSHDFSNERVQVRRSPYIHPLENTQIRPYSDLSYPSSQYMTRDVVWEEAVTFPSVRSHQARACEQYRQSQQNLFPTVSRSSEETPGRDHERDSNSSNQQFSDFQNGSKGTEGEASHPSFSRSNTLSAEKILQTDKDENKAKVDPPLIRVIPATPSDLDVCESEGVSSDSSLGRL